MSSLSLHRLGGKLLVDFRSEGLTDRQEALWLAVTSELEYRRRRQVASDACSCQLCCSPFPDTEGTAAEEKELLEAAAAPRRRRQRTA